MKLNGWHRIGIVLSALWLVAVLSFLAFEFSSADKYRPLSKDKSLIFVYWASPVIIDPFELHLGESLDAFSKQEQLAILQKRESIRQSLSLKVYVGRLCGWLFLPIFSSWMLAYLSVIVFSWVRAGFSHGRKNT